MFMPLCAHVCGTRRPRHTCACTPSPHTHTQNHTPPPPPHHPTLIQNQRLKVLLVLCILHRICILFTGMTNSQLKELECVRCLQLNVGLRAVSNVVVLVCLQPERFVNLGIEPPKGVLLFGPPGTGKTLCARAVANRTDACFIRVIGSELVQKYVGEVRQLRKHQGESWVCESQRS